MHELRANFYYWSEVVRKANKEHKDFIRYCAEHSGLEITTVKGLYPLLDILYAQVSVPFMLNLTFYIRFTIPQKVQMFISSLSSPGVP